MDVPVALESHEIQALTTAGASAVPTTAPRDPGYAFLKVQTGGPCPPVRGGRQRMSMSPGSPFGWRAAGHCWPAWRLWPLSFSAAGRPGPCRHKAAKPPSSLPPPNLGNKRERPICV